RLTSAHHPRALTQRVHFLGRHLVALAETCHGDANTFVLEHLKDPIPNSEFRILNSHASRIDSCAVSLKTHQLKADATATNRHTSSSTTHPASAPTTRCVGNNWTTVRISRSFHTQLEIPNPASTDDPAPSARPTRAGHSSIARTK